MKNFQFESTFLVNQNTQVIKHKSLDYNPLNNTPNPTYNSKKQQRNESVKFNLSSKKYELSQVQP